MKLRHPQNPNLNPQQFGDIHAEMAEVKSDQAANAVAKDVRWHNTVNNVLKGQRLEVWDEDA